MRMHWTSEASCGRLTGSMPFATPPGGRLWRTVWRTAIATTVWSRGPAVGMAIRHAVHQSQPLGRVAVYLGRASGCPALSDGRLSDTIFLKDVQSDNSGCIEDAVKMKVLFKLCVSSLATSSAPLLKQGKREYERIATPSTTRDSYKTFCRPTAELTRRVSECE